MKINKNKNWETTFDNIIEKYTDGMLDRNVTMLLITIKLFISQLLTQTEKEITDKTDKIIRKKDKQIAILKKISGDYSEAISLMADGASYEDLPEELK